MSDTTPTEHNVPKGVAGETGSNSQTGSGAKAGSGSGSGNETVDAGKVNLVNRLAESRSPYVSMSSVTFSPFLILPLLVPQSSAARQCGF